MQDRQQQPHRLQRSARARPEQQDVRQSEKKPGFVPDRPELHPATSPPCAICENPHRDDDDSNGFPNPVQNFALVGRRRSKRFCPASAYRRPPRTRKDGSSHVSSLGQDTGIHRTQKTACEKSPVLQSSSAVQSLSLSDAEDPLHRIDGSLRRALVVSTPFAPAENPHREDEKHAGGTDAQARPRSGAEARGRGNWIVVSLQHRCGLRSFEEVGRKVGRCWCGASSRRIRSNRCASDTCVGRRCSREGVACVYMDIRRTGIALPRSCRRLRGIAGNDLTRTRGSGHISALEGDG